MGWFTTKPKAVPVKVKAPAVHHPAAPAENDKWSFRPPYPADVEQEMRDIQFAANGKRDDATCVRLSRSFKRPAWIIKRVLWTELPPAKPKAAEELIYHKGERPNGSIAEMVVCGTAGSGEYWYRPVSRPLIIPKGLITCEAAWNSPKYRQVGVQSDGRRDIAPAGWSEWCIPDSGYRYQCYFSPEFFGRATGLIHDPKKYIVSWAEGGWTYCSAGRMGGHVIGCKGWLTGTRAKVK